MKKDKDYGKIYQGIDFAQLIRDLSTIEGFTDETVKKAIKLQKSGISIHINAAFYNSVIKPFIGRLQEKGIAKINKISGTRFYTILDKQKAIEIFSTTSKPAGQSSKAIIVIPEKPREEPTPVEPKVIGKIDLETGSKHGVPTIQPRTSKEIQEAINPKKIISKKALRIRFEAWIIVLGYLSRNNITRALSKDLNEIFKQVYGNRINISEQVAYLNTFMARIKEPGVIQRSGKTVNTSLALSGISPKELLDFIINNITDLILKSDITENIILWAKGETNELQAQKKQEPEPEPAKDKSKTAGISGGLALGMLTSRKTDFHNTNTQMEISKSQKSRPKPESTIWVISKMDPQEFKERYGLETRELMKSEKGWLLESLVSSNSDPVVEKIQSELRHGEEIHKIRD